MSKIASKVLSMSKKPGLLNRFLRNSAGSMTSVMGLSVIPILFTAGAAIDYARMTREQAAFYGAVDSAALAIAADERSSLIGLDTDDKKEARRVLLEDYAKLYLNKNYVDASGGKSVKTLKLSFDDVKVKIEATLDFPTSILAITGIKKLSLSSNATVMKTAKPVELVLVMDTTGSMNDSGKLSGAQAAAKDLLAKLYDGTLANKPRNLDLRVGLVPFSGAVRLDTAGSDFDLGWIDTGGANTYSKLNFNAVSGTPAAWNNYYAWSQLKQSTTTSHTWNGCVEARANSTTAATAYNVNDAEPSSASPATLFPAYFNPDVPGTAATATSYGISYIGGTSLTAAGSECKGLSSSTVCSSTSNTNLYLRQENYNKYIGTNIGTAPVAASSSTDISQSYYYGPWGGCAVSKIVPMTYDRGKIETGIDAMRAHGITIIPEGLAWGWRAISPTAPFTKVEGSGTIPGTTISPYKDPKWQKIIVLMTDGDNNVNGGSYSLNTSRYSAYGYAAESGSNNRFDTTIGSDTDSKLDGYMAKVCANIKSEGILLYVASFGNDVSDTTKANLKSCASPGDEFYKHASTPAILTSFFGGIGKTINKSIYVSK
jgi:Putative Flp pilus-assembly TadE/G-like